MGLSMTPSPQKVALVTGAARGIGLAVAKRFLAEGWRVALLDIEGELLQGAVAALEKPDHALTLAGRAHDAQPCGLYLCSTGIRVNGGAPGPVDTAMAKAVHTPEIRADYHDAIPLNRYGLEEELAEAVLFLSCDRSSYVTGQILAVDGGFDAAGIGLPTLRGERRNS